jgi:Tfp pilus assembly protein PilV
MIKIKKIKKGFLIIEFMIALVIFSISVGVWLAGEKLGQTLLFTLKSYDRALVIAREYLESAPWAIEDKKKDNEKIFIKDFNKIREVNSSIKYNPKSTVSVKLIGFYDK